MAKGERRGERETEEKRGDGERRGEERGRQNWIWSHADAEIIRAENKINVTAQEGEEEEIGERGMGKIEGGRK